MKKVMTSFTCVRTVFVFCRDVSDSCLMHVSDIKADLAVHMAFCDLVCFVFFTRFPRGMKVGGGGGEGGLAIEEIIFKVEFPGVNEKQCGICRGDISIRKKSCGISRAGVLV